jgi:hypothetical protein
MNREFSNIPLSDMDADEKHYMIEYTDGVSAAYNDSSNKNFAAANATEQSLSNQLMLINTVVLTASLISFSNEAFYNSLSLPQSILIFIIFTLQILSIISGIFDYMLRRKFFGDGGDKALKIAKYIKTRKYKTINEMLKQVSDYDDKILKKSNRITSLAQIIFIIMGLAFFVILLFSFLFDVPLYSNGL